MSFWRDEVVGFALDRETARHIAEQRDWIAREPSNPRPYAHLAQLYRLEGRAEEARGLLLEAVRLNPALAEAQLALAEMYAVAGDYVSAWRHARGAEAAGDMRAVELLRRYDVAE